MKKKMFKKTKGKGKKVQLQINAQLSKLGSGGWDETEEQKFLAWPNYPIGCVTILDGMTGSRKTWLSMNEAWRLSKGLDIRGGSIPEKGCRVLYLHGDLPKAAFKHRMLQLGITSKKVSDVSKPMLLALHREDLDEMFSTSSSGYGQFCLDLDFDKVSKDGKPTLGEGYRRAFEQMLRTFKPDLVVLDALFAFTVKSASSPKAARDIVSYFKRLAVKFNVSILVIVNHNKGVSKNKMDDICGGATLNYGVPIRESVRLKDPNGTDNEWSYVHSLKHSFTRSTPDHPLNFKFKLVDKTVNGKKRHMTTTVTRVKDGESVEVEKHIRVKKVKYSFDFDWQEVEAEKDSRSAQVTEAILKVVAEHPKSMIVTKVLAKVREIIKCSKSTFTKCKDALVKAGTLEETSAGRKNAKLLNFRKGAK